MDSHVVHHDHGGVEEEDHHEKKSVLKKVKEKAKKIKNTLKGHGHGHEHDHHEGHHNLDEEDDDDEDEDPEVHGASTIRSGVPGQGDILKVPMVKFGDTKAMHDYEDPVKTGTKTSDPMRNYVPDLERTDPMKDYVTGGADHNTRQAHSVASGVMLMHDDGLRQEENLGQHKVNFGRTSVMGEGLHDPQNTPVSSFGEHKSNVTGPGHTFLFGTDGLQSMVNPPISSFGEYKSRAPSHTFASGTEGHVGQSRVNNSISSSGGEYKSDVTDPSHTFASGTEGHFGQSRVNNPVSSLGGGYKSNVTDPSQTFISRKEGDLGQSWVNLDRPKGLEEDPQAPKDNPQAYTRSNYQTKVTDPTNAGGEEIGITPILHSLDKMNIHGGSGTTQKSHQFTGTGSHDQFSAETDEKPSNQGSSYTEKISSATSAIADKAISAKNVVASKLGYGGNNDQHEDINPTDSSYQNVTGPTNAGAVEVAIKPVSGAEQKSHQDQPSNQGSSYTERISSVTSAVANKAVSAKNVVASKLGYGGDNEQHDQDVTERSGGAGNDQHGKSATSAIADKAISAKNAVASKLGYGGNNDQHDQEVTNKYGSTGPGQHGKGIASTVTEKVTPVYEKVAGAGSTVMSKISGGSTGTGTAGEEAHHHRGATGGDYSKARPDKGVSVKDYFVEKLKPGEEDRALSEVISEALHKRKAEHSGGTRPVAKVTESVEVTRRLGPDYGENVEQSSYGKVVADTLKGAVGSLFGKADQTTASQQSLGSSTGTEGFSNSGSGVAERQGHGAEQRRLQGSGN